MGGRFGGIHQARFNFQRLDRKHTTPIPHHTFSLMTPPYHTYSIQQQQLPTERHELPHPTTKNIHLHLNRMALQRRTLDSTSLTSRRLLGRPRPNLCRLGAPSLQAAVGGHPMALLPRPALVPRPVSWGRNPSRSATAKKRGGWAEEPSRASAAGFGVGLGVS